LRAPKRVGELYRNNCVQGERAVLAGALVRSSKYVPAGVVLAETPPAASASSSSAAKPRSKQREYRVRSGDSLLAIAREHSCDLTVLAKANRLQAPNYMIRPGQRLKLKGCEG
jgi:membrane-bound lytic murein transglycosylase D